MLHLDLLRKLWARAFSRMITGEATKASEVEDTYGIFFSLFFFGTVLQRRFGGTLVGLKILLHQQTAN